VLESIPGVGDGFIHYVGVRVDTVILEIQKDSFRRKGKIFEKPRPSKSRQGKELACIKRGREQPVLLEEEYHCSQGRLHPQFTSIIFPFTAGFR